MSPSAGVVSDVSSATTATTSDTSTTLPTVTSPPIQEEPQTNFEKQKLMKRNAIAESEHEHGEGEHAADVDLEGAPAADVCCFLLSAFCLLGSLLVVFSFFLLECLLACAWDCCLLISCFLCHMVCKRV
jgi:hypothetical protein